MQKKELLNGYKKHDDIVHYHQPFCMGLIKETLVRVCVLSILQDQIIYKVLGLVIHLMYDFTLSSAIGICVIGWC